jgi:AbrB family looped-hinge helix DNA binding protein
MNSKGQVVIPAGIRQRQQLRPGDELLIEERDDSIVLRKARRKRSKSLLQWLQDCPAPDFRVEPVRDLPKTIKL